MSHSVAPEVAQMTVAMTTVVMISTTAAMTAVMISLNLLLGLVPNLSLETTTTTILT